MTTTSDTRYRAVLDLIKDKVHEVLAGSKVVYNAMLAETTLFPSPVPTLALVLGQINALDTAQQAVDGGQRGAATGRRNAARDALWTSLVSLKVYVQGVADASVEDSFTILKSSGFTVFAPHARSKPVLAAADTGISGAVKLSANAQVLTGGSRNRPTYNWQYSVDGGHTWVSVPATPLATTTVSGLPPLATCSFRVNVTLRQTVGAWSQAVTILVH